LIIDLIQEETLMNNINSSIDNMSTLYVGKRNINNSINQKEIFPSKDGEGKRWNSYQKVI
jgi:hypothetical protein